MTTASLDDLEEIAEGKASARDKEEAGVDSMVAARRLLSARGYTMRVSHAARPVGRKVKRRRR